MENSGPWFPSVGSVHRSLEESLTVWLRGGVQGADGGRRKGDLHRGPVEYPRAAFNGSGSRTTHYCDLVGATRAPLSHFIGGLREHEV